MALLHAGFAHPIAVRGFFLWLLFRALSRTIGPVGATGVIVAVIVAIVLVARRQQQR